MKFSVISLFPDLFESFQKLGVVGQAFERGDIELSVHSPRSWTKDIHKTVDDRPFGGGDGMVLMAEPLSLCLDSILNVPLDSVSTANSSATAATSSTTSSATSATTSVVTSGATSAATSVTAKSSATSTISSSSISTHSSSAAAKVRRVYLSPQGKPLHHELVMELAKEEHVLLLCGRYAGVDQRLLNAYSFEEISVGDYVLSGGELAALVVMDAVARQLEGVLGHKDSSKEDSFAVDGLLEAPCYTRPRQWRDQEVPEFFLTGNHAQIAEDRWILGVLMTFVKRPDLCELYLEKQRGQGQTIKRKTWQKAVAKVQALSNNELTSLGISRKDVEAFDLYLRAHLTSIK